MNGIARWRRGAQRFSLDPRYTDLQDLVLAYQERINDTGESARVRVTAGSYGSDVGCVVELRRSLPPLGFGPRIPAAVGSVVLSVPEHPAQPLPEPPRP